MDRGLFLSRGGLHCLVAFPVTFMLAFSVHLGQCVDNQLCIAIIANTLLLCRNIYFMMMLSVDWSLLISSSLETTKSACRKQIRQIGFVTLGPLRHA